MSKFKYLSIGMIAMLFSLQSCVDVQCISNFSKSGVAALQKNADISYSATKRCRDDCEVNELIAQLNDKKTFGDKAKDIINAPNDNCLCTEFVKADKSLSAFNNVIIAYLSALNKLSDPKAANSSFDKVSTATNDLVANAKITSISKDAVDAAGNLAQIITNFILEGYRQTKLKKAIDSADAPFSKIIEAYVAALSELQKLINEESGEWKDYYEKRHIGDGNENNSVTYLKALNDQVLELKKQYDLIETFKGSLIQIENAHKKLKQSSGNLNEKTLAQDLNVYTQQLISIYNQFNNLKK